MTDNRNNPTHDVASDEFDLRPRLERYAYEVHTDEGFNGAGPMTVCENCLAFSDKAVFEQACREHEADFAEHNDVFTVTVWADDEGDSEREFCLSEFVRCYYELTMVLTEQAELTLPEGWTGHLLIELYQDGYEVFGDEIFWDEECTFESVVMQALRDARSLGVMGLQDIRRARLVQAEGKRECVGTMDFEGCWRFEHTMPGY